MTSVPDLMKDEFTPEQIKENQIYLQWSLTEPEYDLICERLGRLPNYTETGLFAAMWSEHCSYKKSKPVLRKFWSENERVLQGPGEGAGVLDIGDNQAVVFKAESHNHPSAVEPYEGAATGVGGIIRDIFSMGAQPIAILDSLRFGEIEDNQTKHLINGIVAGIAGYGNALGIPTVGGDMALDKTYQKNPLVNAMAVGILDHEDLHVGQANGVGNRILYIGAKTGRDGIHGATFASSDFDSSEEQNRSAVQVGDPFLEKLVMDTTIAAIKKFKKAIVGVQDMGAAGLVSSSAEMAGKAGNGVHLNLDLVPQRETNLTPYELMLSESQERMLMVVKEDQMEAISQLFFKQGLEAVDIGAVTDDGKYVLTFEDQVVTDLQVKDLLTPPKQKMPTKAPARVLAPVGQNEYLEVEKDFANVLDKMLQQSTVASKRDLFRHYDSMVRTDTVIRPGGDAGVVRIKGTKKALAMTTDVNGRKVFLNPKIGGQLAVAEAAQNIVCTGATPIGITDCLNFGDPDDPEIYYELEQACAGINDFAKQLNTPIISGNVSLYNETDGKAIYPTPMVGMVGLLADVNKATTIDFKNAGDLIYLVGELKKYFAGSELQKLIDGEFSGNLADFSSEVALQNQTTVLSGINQQFINAAHDISEGGLAVTLSEMSFNTDFGFTTTIKHPLSYYFAEGASQYVVTVSKEHQSEFEALGKGNLNLLGETTLDNQLSFANAKQTVVYPKANAKQTYQEAISWKLNH
ncbi:phosphoribosylformylglycinamidine synthase subunit PurL [Fructilactobacillus vespulae]|uniref:phosphoribosylformylglycinamidine synthase subunit PurL n=1 Tax=Fructilactobacillus vespulae TaxID=1249630 RepID=UPI0039B58F30